MSANTQQQDDQCLHINEVDMEKKGNTKGCEGCEKIGSLGSFTSLFNMWPCRML